ncbi:MAG TPA: iron-containing redox enzyme family protein [Mycobacteriales bacterium]|nr:iron-containing redox enzyme family protein [Mycobacteriales bacterium]
MSERLLAVLRGEAPPVGLSSAPVVGSDPFGEDLQLCLYLAYELHYRAIDGVDDALEWDPDVLRFRSALERSFLHALREVAGAQDEDVEGVLAPLLVEPVGGTGPSWHLSGAGELWQLREYAAHRSIYHLKEADPQAWVVPRLEGQAKASLVTVQHDEYGAGRADRMHAAMFARLLRDLDLDHRYGAYLDLVPAVTLAPVNLMSMAGLHRALRGVAFAHFVMIEVTSSPGSRRISQAFERLGAGPGGQAFYDEHVEADAVHEQLLRAGLRDLVDREPGLAADVVLGLRASSALEQRFGDHLLDCWDAGRSSLRAGL